jgi:hypothetical protein
MRTLALFSLLTLALAAASCKRSDVSVNQNSSSAPGAAAGKPSSVPPFATKEPERYQATRVTSGGDGAGASSEVFIARDGERRREEYRESAGARVYVEGPEGRYLLLPAKKLYAEVHAGTGGRGGGAEVPPDFSPEKLLNESRPQTFYERLGEENVNGRQTVKYRATVRNTETGPTLIESLIWVDERLGMPVKSETNASGAHVTMELRDLKETIDAGLFEIPADYKRVTLEEISAQAPGQTGSGRD